MRLSRLVVRHFRNLGSQELELPGDGVALVGDNAQGKSNFLEAIYYLETLRSFRGARDDQLVAFGEEVFRVVGTAEADTEDGSDDTNDASVEVAAAFERRGRRKKVTIDGHEADRLTDALGHLSAVVFSPSDIELVSGGPSERRRFLDIVLSLNEPGYVDSLQEYRRVLQHRNAALKSGASPSSVAAWNPGLVRAGASVVVARARWVRDRAAAFGCYYAQVSDVERAVMEYAPDVRLTDEGSFAEASVETAEEAIREALATSAERERRRAVTVIGPHRDDVRLRLEHEDERLDLRDYGSGGQRRTAALALRLVEAGTIRERRRRKPMVLLDDVFAELDPGRSERILDLMENEEIGQVVLTAPKESDVRIRRDRLVRWRISNGAIEA